MKKGRKVMTKRIDIIDSGCCSRGSPPPPTLTTENTTSGSGVRHRPDPASASLLFRHLAQRRVHLSLTDLHPIKTDPVAVSWERSASQHDCVGGRVLGVSSWDADGYQVVPTGAGATKGVHFRKAGSISLYSVPLRLMRSLYSSITSCNTGPLLLLPVSWSGSNDRKMLYIL
uniref:Uncharacterized protein n=1 Tax=Timema monikensis TaxID=170555 RepID=A0A7R9EIK8_9NEOP|nr:unnamed protein product [Timema monikensis]